jgi:transposase
MSRREAASWRRVSVATVQYWIERYRTASDAEQASGRVGAGSALDAAPPARPGQRGGR